MARPKLTEQMNLHEAIKEIAWQEIAQKGTASLSLRAIARKLNITAPAIYNHYRRKEDLVTALILDAYADFGNSQLKAIENLPGDDYSGRLKATGLAYRQWAVNNPQRYLLIFGTPLSCNPTQSEKMAPAASHSLTALLSVLEGARKNGILVPKDKAGVSPNILEQLKMWQQLSLYYDPYILYIAVIIWSRVHGLMMFELGKQYPDFIKDPGEIYNSEVESITQQYLIYR
jgi:AcrR family transcriptional regulator